MKSIEEQMEAVLESMENGSYTVDMCIEETKETQPAILDYLFDEGNHYLTPVEKDQLLFIHAVLWKFKKSNLEIGADDLHDLEEVFWEEAEKSNFPYDTTHPDIDTIHDELFAVLVDACDTEINELSDIGAKWLLTKGLVLACSLCN